MQTKYRIHNDLRSSSEDFPLIGREMRRSSAATALHCFAGCACSSSSSSSSSATGFDFVAVGRKGRRLELHMSLSFGTDYRLLNLKMCEALACISSGGRKFKIRGWVRQGMRTATTVVRFVSRFELNLGRITNAETPKTQHCEHFTS